MVVTVGAISFDDGSQRVLEQFETDVGQVSWNVAEVEVLRADQLNWGSFEHPNKLGSGQKPWRSEEAEEELPIMFLTYVSCVLDRFLDDIVDVLINEHQVSWVV